MEWTSFFRSPRREYGIAALVVLSLALDFFFPTTEWFLVAVALLGSFPTLFGAWESIRHFKINIDAFNIFALAISFLTREFHSAAFIVLMLAFASLLDWRTESRAHDAVKTLLQLKPARAMRERGDMTEDIVADDIHTDDILVIKEGARVPADGVVTFGNGLLNESSVTGESIPIEKSVGDRLIAGTLNESGTMKMRVTRSGKDSTLEQMAELIREAQKNKSRSERLADRFAEIFLPVVLVIGIITYIITRDVLMTAALFLVACADDMAVAIPLAITASLGQAAKRGVVVKGGEWLDNLGKIDTLVLDKTGTLTYGKFAFRNAVFLTDVVPETFWRAVGSAEKFSEHPAGNAIWKEATKHDTDIPDPAEFKTYKGGGVWAKTAEGEVVIGDEKLFTELGIPVPQDVAQKLLQEMDDHAGTTVIVALEKKMVGFLSIADVPRTEAKDSIKRIKDLGVHDVVMYTGDNEIVAKGVAAELGMDSYKASMLPEKKLVELENMEKAGHLVAMVGDGVNDAPALARADVGIAMGSGGTAVAVESADIVILTDNLARIPEMITLGRRTASVIRWIP